MKKRNSVDKAEALEKARDFYQRLDTFSDDSRLSIALTMIHARVRDAGGDYAALDTSGKLSAKEVKQDLQQRSDGIHIRKAQHYLDLLKFGSKSKDRKPKMWHERLENALAEGHAGYEALDRSGKSSASEMRDEVSEALKTAYLRYAKQGYDDLWNTFIVSADENKQKFRDSFGSRTRPDKAEQAREYIKLSGHDLTALTPGDGRSAADIDAEITKLVQNEVPLKLGSLHHVAGWQRIKSIAKKFEADGQSLDKATLKTPCDKDGGDYLARAANCRAFSIALGYLNGRDEQLTAEDLLTDAREPNSLLNTLMKNKHLPTLMQPTNWLGQSSANLRAVYRALPPKGRDQIGNYNSLLNTLQTQEKGESRGR